MQGVYFWEELETSQRGFGICVNEVSGIEFNFDEVLPRERVVLVAHIRGGRVEFGWKIFNILEWDLNLLSLAANDDSLERSLAVEERDRGMSLWEKIQHLEDV